MYNAAVASAGARRYTLSKFATDSKFNDRLMNRAAVSVSKQHTDNTNNNNNDNEAENK